jgi:hypothetical protein
VPRLHAVSTKQICPVLFLHQLSDLLSYRQGKNQFLQPLARLPLKNGVLACLSDWSRCSRRRDRDDIQCSLQPIGENVMVLAAFLSNRGLDGRTQSGSIAGCTGANNRQKEIASSHLVVRMAKITTP